MEKIQAELVVLGAGPGGYAAAFYAADKGRNVLLVEQGPQLGGVCLHQGCIPSKALLHATAVMREATSLSSQRGIVFGTPTVELARLRNWKRSVVEKLAQGLGSLAKARGVQVLRGRGHFEPSQTLRVETADGQHFVSYQTAIVAVGSKPSLPKAFDLGNPRIMTSTEALDLEEIPPKLLIVGGGYIGLELGTVFATLGSRVVVAEATDSLLPGVDADLVRPVRRAAEEAFEEIRLQAKVSKMATSGKQISVTVEADGRQRDELYDRVLVAVGRVPNCEDLGLEQTRVEQDDRGFLKVNAQQRTADPAIYAIGDVTGGALLAHKASKEARIAVEAITGQASTNQALVMPAVVFTDPEVAWCGVTETEAKRNGLSIQVAKFPWAASGRALTLDRTDGLTKLIIEAATERLVGVGIVGAGAGELIGEAVVAIEMGATAHDLAESIHPHPTLSETLKEAADVFYGYATHTAPRTRPQSAEPSADDAG